MALDVVVRPEGRCIAIVCDRGTARPDSIDVDGADIFGIEDGRRYLIGTFTPAMAEKAALCTIAVVVVMDGCSVHSSREVPLAKDS